MLLEANPQIGEAVCRSHRSKLSIRPGSSTALVPVARAQVQRRRVSSLPAQTKREFGRMIFDRCGEEELSLPSRAS